MSKTSTIRARVQPELKHEVEAILKELGLNATEAIVLYYRQIKLHHGIPFDVKLPNRITAQTFKDTDENRNLTEYDSLQDAFDELDALCSKSLSPSNSKKIMSGSKNRVKT